MQTITNEFIFNSFILGAKNVVEEKDVLNKINVFPVADGDTGTNLSSLMQSIIYYSQLKDSTKDTLESIAEAAMKGSRGNSGIIFASYIDGFYQAVEHDQITVEEYIEICHNAATIAKSSIANPVEGTVITLMQSWVNILESLKNATSSLKDLFVHAYDKLKLELAKTTDKLEVLKQNKVVDAGAQGFVHFIGGIIHALSGKTVDKTEIKTIEIDEHEDFSSYDPNEPRYCTEAYLKDLTISKEALRDKLSQFGDSLIVASHESQARIHIHTNEPSKVFNELRDVSLILDQKVDDMKLQYETAHDRKYDIAIVTDSIADLPKSFVDDAQIHVYPITLNVDGTSYFDKLTLNNDMFYDMMNHAKTYPASSQPNPKQLENMFSYLSTYYKKILVLTVSSKMSGTYQVFKDMADKFKSDIRVIDTVQNSASEGLLVYRASELVKAGKSIDEIENEINDLKLKTRILVSVKTLKYMVKNGRLSKVTGLVAKLLNLKPVVSIDHEGEGIIYDKALSMKSADAKIKKHITKLLETQKIENYAIVHAQTPERAKAYEDMMISLTGQKPLYTMEISSVIAMNAGIGAVAVAYMLKS